MKDLRASGASRVRDVFCWVRMSVRGVGVGLQRPSVDCIPASLPFVRLQFGRQIRR